MVPVIGSLRNHEEDDSHNVKKKTTIGLTKKNSSSVRASRF